MASRSPLRTLSRTSLYATRSSQHPYRCFSCSLRSPQQPSTPPSPSRPAQDEPTTHFGFQTLPSSLKQSKVASVFSSVAPSYDTMNDLMSLGIHRLWKDHFVRSLLASLRPSSSPTTTPLQILDVAGGTADISLRLLLHPSLASTAPRITISDINPAMLAAGRARLARSHPSLLPHLSFLTANAEALPASIPASSIDLYTVAFGIRNFTDKAAALREAYRVLKPGGVFACLEFSKVTNPLFEGVYKRWSFGAIPLIGQLVAGDRESYQYLVESIERFPAQREFMEMVQAAGFVVPGGEGGGWEDLTGGVCAIHKGVKPV